MDIWSARPHLSCTLYASIGGSETDRDSGLVLPSELRARLDGSSIAREQIAQLRVLNIDFYPRESHLITFRDPWSFPTLFHPACNQLVRSHMDDLAQKVQIFDFFFLYHFSFRLSIMDKADNAH